MDLAQATNAPEVIDFAGRRFPVRQLRLVEWGELQSFLKRALPDPVARTLKSLAALQAEGAAIDPALRDAALAQAQIAARDWPPRVGSRRWLAALDDAEGGHAEFVRVALTYGGTPTTPAEAEDLAEAATDEEFGELVRVAYLGEPPRPKPAPPSTSSTSPTTTASASATSGGPSSTPSRRPGTGRTRRSPR
jgi:hypothetical protein